ncbi:winged helix-turn-helix transcriptional regulator [Paenibacillus agricola]|uniref:Helix-turn-helix transcriptional regulator n=1 Tax=Paenibacillus agricola TaxID=2716264 RepID=A0ABX0JDC8_9BACL|nr:helix-turn-helix domain-containing protein [Paenibacillus agricola]NHN31695.1 helix-turn-helix transcriptional regulator [Paenibacillus agricola]
MNERKEDELCLISIREALEVVRGKWSFLVLSLLSLGPQRFNQMRRNLDNISIKSLTDVLRHLEQYQVINRQVFPTVPVTVEYSLTDKGREYIPVLQQMRIWGENWGEHPKLVDGRETSLQYK